MFLKWVQNEIQVVGFQTWADFKIMVRQGLEQIKDATRSGDTIGVFTSGGTISAMIAEIMNIQDDRTIASLNFNVQNTSITTLLYSKRRASLLRFNMVEHLNDNELTFV